MRYIHDSDQPLCVGLEGVLEAFRASSEPTTVNVGYARVLNFSQKLAVVWELKDATPASQNWLLLPLSDNGLDHVSILRSCHELQQVSKLEIEGNMRVVFLPEGFYDVGELPFEIQFEAVVSFCLPKLFAPLPRRTVKKRVAFIDECLSHLYQFLYGRLPEQADPLNIDIPYFYSILTPALSIQSRKAQDAMQPEALIPDLLPFQRRSLAWLLGREGKEVTAQGEILSKTNHAEYSFWDHIEEGNHTFYYNRLSQMLHLEKPDIEGTYGGILAEEPGLGKTVEMISLILLNPAPPDRNPSMERWDPESQLNVKAVKVRFFPLYDVN
jgi:E3 ubiquitin-protein ligase SHPRH